MLGFKKIHVFYGFLLSYTLVLLLPVLIGGIIYREMITVVKAQEIESALAFLEKTENVISSSLIEIDRMSVALAGDPYVRRFALLEKPLEGPSLYSAFELVRHLDSHDVGSPFVDSFYVYFRNSDRVVMMDTSYEASRFYESYFGYDELSYSEWRELFLEAAHDKNILPSKPVTVAGVSTDRLTYVRSFPAVYDQNPTIVVWVLIDEDAINRLLEEMFPQGYAYVVEESGQLVASPRENAGMVEAEAAPFRGETGFFDRVIDNEKVIVSYMNSSLTNWKYVSILPYRVVLERTRSLRSLIAVAAAVILLLGSITTYLLSWGSSKPLGELVSIISGRKPLKDGDEINEYLFIKRGVRELLDKNSSLEQRMKEQLPLLRAAFFDRLFKGEYASEEEIRTILTQLGINIGGSFFAIAIARMRAFEGSVITRRLNSLYEAGAIIERVVSSRFAGRAHIHTRTEDEAVLLVSYDDSEAEGYRIIMEGLLGEIYEELTERYQMQLSFAAGNIYPSLTDVWHSYRESVDALDSMRIDNCFAVMWNENKRKRKSGYYYPLSLEEHLINNAKAGNGEEVKSILRLIYEENMTNHRLLPDTLRLFLNDMQCSVLKCLNQIGLDKIEDDNDLMDRINELSSCGCFNDAYDIIEDAYMTICKAVDSLKKSHRVDLILKIKQFIEEEYQDPLLNRYTVAKRFGMTEEYLSSFFKEQTGTNFSDFLQETRLKKASELLSEHDMPIGTIAVAVGYRNAKVFSRAFKRVNGISPSDYRSSIR